MRVELQISFDPRSLRPKSLFFQLAQQLSEVPHFYQTLVVTYVQVCVFCIRFLLSTSIFLSEHILDFELRLEQTLHL
jgi:hypothetical protein